MKRFSTFFRSSPWPRRFGIVAGIFVALLLLFLGLAKLASWGAAGIFNLAAAHQDMLRGTITVEEIHANTRGGVRFVNLAWDDPEGHPIARVPEGTFQVRVWDIITRHFRSTTIEAVTLNRPAFAVAFDENMRVDFVNRETEEQLQAAHIPLETRVANFNRGGKTMKMKVRINDARLQSFYENRSYQLNHVNIALDLNTRGRTKFDISTGAFGGDAVGEGIELYGEADFGEPGIPISTDATIRGVDPSSLGFGDSIHDPLTLKTYAHGPIAGPTAVGTLTMDELHIPALDFSTVKGDVRYEDGTFTFTNVNARVYGGTVTARGDYHMASRAYNIYLYGDGLDTRIPLKSPDFYCLVDLTGELHCDGNPESLTADGTFHSGKGFYKLAPFHSLSGTFHNDNDSIDFYDVAIETRMGTITTDAFHIVDGNLVLGNIRFHNSATGDTTTIDAARETGPSGTFQAIGRDVGEIRKRIAELKP